VQSSDFKVTAALPSENRADHGHVDGCRPNRH
jgi:hypothetical protein